MIRTDYIGASEVGAIVTGQDEYGRTPLSIYLEKKGLKPAKESSIMQRGLDLEPVLLSKYTKMRPDSWEVSYQPTPWDQPLTHSVLPWLGCHPDAYVSTPEGRHILEFKLTSSQAILDPDELKTLRPSWYYQCQTMMMITGAYKVEVFVWLNSTFAWEPLQTIEVLPDKEVMADIVTKCSNFYVDHLQGNQIPSHEEIEKPELKTDYTEEDKETIQMIEDFAALAKQTKGLNESYEATKEKLKAKFQETTHRTIKAGDIVLKANWKQGASRLSKDLLIAKGIDLVGCFERGKPVYTLEVMRSKDGNGN